MNYKSLITWLDTKTPTARELIYEFLRRASENGFTNIVDIQKASLEPKVKDIQKKRGEAEV